MENLQAQQAESNQGGGNQGESEELEQLAIAEH